MTVNTATRNQEIVSLIDAGEKAVRIAASYGISKQRVAQIYKAMTGEKPNMRVRRRERNPWPHCAGCGKTLRKRGQTYCRPCGKTAKRVERTCEECGKRFEVRRAVLDYTANHADREGGRGRYCSKTCFGKYQGRTYGFSAHPGNAVKAVRGPRTALTIALTAQWPELLAGRRLSFPDTVHRSDGHCRVTSAVKSFAWKRQVRVEVMHDWDGLVWVRKAPGV